MKKVISVILLIILAMLCLFGCGAKKARKAETGKHLISDNSGKDGETNTQKEKCAVIVLKAEKESPTSSEMENAKKIIRTRLDNLGYTEAAVKTLNGNKIEAEIPHLESPETVAETLGKITKITFCDESGNIILDGDSIKSARAERNKSSDAENEGYYILLEFTKDGRERFAKATGENIGKSIYITIDDSVIAAPTVQNEIDSDSCIISGDFTKEDAEFLAANIKAGQLSFPFVVSEISRK